MKKKNEESYKWMDSSVHRSKEMNFNPEIDTVHYIRTELLIVSMTPYVLTVLYYGTYVRNLFWY